MNDPHPVACPIGNEFSKRRNSRFKCVAQAEVILTMGNRIHCTIVDLSQTGCCVLSYSDIENAQNFRIRLPGIESQQADVVWKKGYLYGIQFRRPMAVYVIDHLVKMIGLEE